KAMSVSWGLWNGISCRRFGGAGVGALADLRVAARLVRDRAAGDAAAVVGEPGQCGLLDELVRVLVDRLDARGLQLVARAGTDLRDQHGMAVVDRVDDRRQGLVLAVAALAVQVDAAVADEGGAE